RRSRPWRWPARPRSRRPPAWSRARRVLPPTPTRSRGGGPGRRRRPAPCSRFRRPVPAPAPPVVRRFVVRETLEEVAGVGGGHGEGPQDGAGDVLRGAVQEPVRQCQAHGDAVGPDLGDHSGRRVGVTAGSRPHPPVGRYKPWKAVPRWSVRRPETETGSPASTNWSWPMYMATWPSHTARSPGMRSDWATWAPTSCSWARRGISTPASPYAHWVRPLQS